MLVYILQGIGYGFAAAVQPGPLQTYIISQTLRNGWRRSLPAALAPLVSDGPILALVLLVLSQMPAWLQNGLYVAGGVFIVYLALGAFKAWRAFDVSASSAAPAGQHSLVRAALMNLLNPAPYIYWSLVTGPILLAGWRESPVSGIGFLAGFYAAIITSLAGTILLFGTARQLGPRVNRVLLGLSAITLACFGLYQVWRGLSGFYTS